MALEIASFDEELLYLIGGERNNDNVKSIIEKKDLYNVADSSKNTLLHVAAQKNTEITRYLIDTGSNVDAQNERGQTPLMLAIEAICEETVEVLLEAGASIELQDNLGKSALQMIVENDDVATGEVLGLFFRKLQIASSNNKEEIAKKLIDARWPLDYVACLKDSSLTRIILQSGFAKKIIDASDPFGNMALHFAVESVDAEHVKLLLEYNANVNYDNGVERSPLCYVYDGSGDRPNERLDILKMLLDRGAILNCADSDFEAYGIFQYADKEAMKLLFQSNVDQHPDFCRIYALFALAQNRNLGAIEEIRGRGFDVIARNHIAQTPLMVAAICGNAETVEFLLNEGANTYIDAKDFRNFSALFYAINKHPKSKQIVQTLLERDANVQYEIHHLEQNEIRYRGVSTILDLILKTELFSLGELVLAHLALQETVGPFVTETIRDQIDACDRFKTYYESCKQQLPMKVYELMTLFDILTATNKKLEDYVRNEDFVSNIQDACNTLTDHCYFRTILQKRLAKAVHKANLKYEAAQVIFKITGMDNVRCPLIADNIISYLEYKDIINLVNALL